ncbi:hypothetical protein JOB18_001993 [Solea senegalensis]|uniref:Uncharacterized protein n=1 Tax=Solea senegalensis TaxID=28829 RepID=A0AAV6PGL2_SOLSE|nr:hypothetical protein JOB18_001993 [Solea senegalensis]
MSDRRKHDTHDPLLPPRPRPHVDMHLCPTDTQPLCLQVQGFCCPLQQRPGSSSSTTTTTTRAAPLSRGGADARLIVLRRGSVESRAQAESRIRSGTTHTGAGLNQRAEPPRTPDNNDRRAGQRQPGAAKVPELHLYLPSTLCEDTDHDSEAEETRYESQSQ